MVEKGNEKQKLDNNRRMKINDTAYFANYLEMKLSLGIDLPIAVTYDIEDQAFIRELRQLIIEMCSGEAQRPTLELVKDRMLRLPRNHKIVALPYEKFTDLHYLGDS